ncbi:MAG: DUF1508 domain-containing protein [Gemmataceae bacterium]|nr:DUF1508 domain-containing protein [Gemmataceae bacterium]
MTASRLLFALPLFGTVLALAGPAPAQKEKDKDAPKLKFELYKDKADEYRWRLKAGNNKVLATGGQGYKDKADAKRGIELVQSGGAAGKFEVYEDEKKEYRWRFKAANGKVVAGSSEGYKEKGGAEKAADLVKDGAKKAEVVEVKDDGKGDKDKK